MSWLLFLKRSYKENLPRTEYIYRVVVNSVIHFSKHRGQNVRRRLLQVTANRGYFRSQYVASQHLYRLEVIDMRQQFPVFSWGSYVFFFSF